MTRFLFFSFSFSDEEEKSQKKKNTCQNLVKINERTNQTPLMSATSLSTNPRYESSIDTFQLPLGTCQARDDPRIINPSFRCVQERGRERNGAYFDVQFVCSTRDRRVKLNPPFLLYVPPFAPPRYNITQSRHVRRPKRIGLRARTETAKIPGSLDR